MKTIAKNIFKMMFVLCCMVLFNSCAEDIVNDEIPSGTLVPVTITASQEGDGDVSRTSLNANDKTEVDWSANDAFAVFDNGGTGANIFNITSGVGKSSATFSGSVHSGSTEYWAVYPCSSVTCSKNGDVVTLGGVTIPIEQTATAGTFDPNAGVLTAHSTNTNFTFRHVCTYAKVTVADDLTNCTAIEICAEDGNAIAGTFDLKLGTDGAFTEATVPSGATTSNIVTLVPSGTNKFIAPGTYYIAMLPKAMTTFECTFVLGNDQGVTNAYRTRIKHGNITQFNTRKKNINVGSSTDGGFATHEFVSLTANDITTKWGTMNVGASSAKDIGKFFAWGETTGCSSATDSHFSWDNYKWNAAEANTPSKEYYVTKYTFEDGKYQGIWYNNYENAQNIIQHDYIGSLGYKNQKELLPEDDVATYYWGHHWKTPSIQNFKDLQTLMNISIRQEGCTAYGTDSNYILLRKNEGTIYMSNELGTISSYYYGYYFSGSWKWPDCNRYEAALVRPVVK